MSRPFPYTFISCPCADSPVPDPARNRRSRDRDSPQKPRPDHPAPAAHDEDEKTFDPRSPRANFSLYPIEQLLYCEDCHQIKCPRCITEEIVSWYCPNCLFEAPSSTVRSEENRYVSRPRDAQLLTRGQMREELLQLPHLHRAAGRHGAGEWQPACPAGPRLCFLHVDYGGYRDHLRQAYQHPLPAV